MEFLKSWSLTVGPFTLAFFSNPALQGSVIQTMLLRKLPCGQLTGVIFCNPLGAFFRARSRPTLQGESFHNPSFSLLSSLDQDVPGLTLTILQTVSSPTSIYGSGLGADASPRVIQLQAKITF